MITTSNITMQFGAKPLFENVSVRFGEGNRYGLIGANGCGKSTFMKILGGDLEASSGSVSVDGGERVGIERRHRLCTLPASGPGPRDRGARGAGPRSRRRHGLLASLHLDATGIPRSWRTRSKRTAVP